MFLGCRALLTVGSHLGEGGFGTGLQRQLSHIPSVGVVPYTPNTLQRLIGNCLSLYTMLFIISRWTREPALDFAWGFFQSRVRALPCQLARSLWVQLYRSLMLYWCENVCELHGSRFWVHTTGLHCVYGLS